MKKFNLLLLILLMAGIFSACTHGTTITGNPPALPLPTEPVDGGGDNGGGTAIDKAAFAKAAIEANPLWKDNASPEGVAKYFVEFPRESDTVNIHHNNWREVLSFKYIIRTDGSVASVADDKTVSLIGSVNEDITALNLWLIAEDGTVLATLTSEITEKDQAFITSTWGVEPTK